MRGGLQFLGEAAGGDPKLTRDIQALPEVFPTGVDMPIEPPSALAARNALSRSTPFSPQRPISVQEITDAIRRSDANALQPSEPPAALPPTYWPIDRRPQDGGAPGAAQAPPEPPRCGPQPATQPAAAGARSNNRAHPRADPGAAGDQHPERRRADRRRSRWPRPAGRHRLCGRHPAAHRGKSRFQHPERDRPRNLNA